MALGDPQPQQVGAREVLAGAAVVALGLWLTGHNTMLSGCAPKLFDSFRRVR